MKLVNTFIQFNIFLSVAAVLLTVSTQIQLGLKPQWQPYLLLIFLATLFEYNRHQLVTTITKRITINSVSHTWLLKNLNWINWLVFIALSGLLTIVFQIKPEILVVLSLLGIITILYSFPVQIFNKYIFNLREIPYLKIFLIVSVWTASTVFLPVIQGDTEIFNLHVFLVFAERFFFIFAIAIQFDIRDIQADQDAGLKTIPILINRKNSFLLSCFSLFVCLIISFFHYKMQNEWFVISALSISVLTTYIFIIMHFSENRSRYYYQILDGTLTLQGILVLVFYFRYQV